MANTILKNTLKKFLPKRFSSYLYKINKSLTLRSPENYCILCNSKFSSFLPSEPYYTEMWGKYQFIHSVFCFETYNFLKHHCPKCYSSDRNRLYALYFKQLFYTKSSDDICFLDIAPDKMLAKWIRENSKVQYRSVDLYRTDVDDNADITDLNIYKDEQFDIILCSHVLEHIENDIKAISELYRILKTGGIAIMMVPIMLTLSEDLENPNWVSDADRWKYYGQNDHVRMYSKSGFIRKLEQAGFTVRQLGIEYFEIDTSKRMESVITQYYIVFLNNLIKKLCAEFVE
ncbi:MAG: methyltransferase domain-containing protein [Bacteroidales bacterium]|nr:methyltransferase domain-containing protein [Bacteroidales bacterium]